MKKLAYLMLIASILGLAACDNPVEEDHDHAEVDGLILVSGSTHVVEVEEGVATGQLTITVGEDPVEFEVEFTDHDGHEIHAEDLDDEFSLAVISDDTAIATVTVEGRFGFMLDGIAAGTTEMEVQLLHDGHADFRTPKITVVVSQ